MGKHAVSFHSYWRGITTTALLLIFRCGWAEEVVHGRVSGVGTPSSETDSGLPPSLNVNLSIAADDLQLNFTKDTDIDPDLPVYTLFTDDSEKLQIRREKLKRTKVFGLYQDIKNGAAVGISQEMDQNGTSHFNLEGVLHSKGKVYDVRNVQQNPNTERRHRRDVSDNVTSDGEDQEFVLKLHEDFSPDNFDSIRKPPFILKKKTMAPFRNITRPVAVQVPTAPPLRHKREVTQDVYIDVVAIADYAVYVDWYDRSTKTTQSEKQQEALENIRQYYAFVFNGINLMYKSIVRLPYTIHVKLSSVIVSTSGSASQWTEKYRVTSPQWDEVDANSALNDLSNWARTTDLLPAYDHIMLFSGYDLTRSANGGTSDKITGLAYTATLCDTNGKASSIVEDLGGFQCMSTAAHELGHSLSAEHDGSENSCTSTDRYIMAAGTNPETEANKLNPWLFSPCSINYFNNFLTDEVRYNRGRTCLYQSLTANPNVPDVTSEMPGQLYDADAQCRQVYGPESRLCRGPEFGQPEDVCTDMYCYDPTTSSTCFMLVAARGTSCGNKKWCDGGQCVYNSAAPALNENCVFGDQPGIAFSEQDCPTFVDNFPGYCYQEVVRGRCCGSCARYYNPVQNCEYGDRAAGCSSFGCSRGETSYLESCCGTCNYGEPIPTTTTTTRSTTTTARPPPVTTTTAARVTTGGVTLKTTTSPGTAVDGTCVDDPTITINQQSCSALVSSGPEYCYNERVNSYCCASCRLIYTGVTGCEFGDYNSSYCAGEGTSSCGLFFTDGSSFDAYCCGTCEYIPPVTTTAAATTTTITPTTTTITTTTTRPTTTTSRTTTTTTRLTTTTSTTTTTTSPATTTTSATTTTTPTTTSTPRTTTTTTTRPTTTTSTTTTTSPTTTTTTTTTTTSTPRTTTTTTGIPSTTTRTPDPTTRTTSTLTTIAPETLPPSTPTFVATTTEEACVDDIGNSACAQVSRARHVCYNATLASLCCATCSRLSNNRPDCEFGDISPTECAVLTPGSDYCRNLTSQCCQTCGVDATGAQDRASSSIVMVVLAVSTVILSFKSFRAL